MLEKGGIHSNKDPQSLSDFFLNTNVIAVRAGMLEVLLEMGANFMEVASSKLAFQDI